MMTEATLQANIIRWLKYRGSYVVKTQPGAGVPVGCPDIIFFKEGFWGALEVKASEKSKFQALQELTIAKLDDWSYCKIVFPENWDEIRSELETIFDVHPVSKP